MPSQAYISKMVAALLKMNEHTTKKSCLLPSRHKTYVVFQITFALYWRQIGLNYSSLEVFRVGVPACDRLYSCGRNGTNLPSLRYCIDSALQLTNEFNARHGLHVMVIKPTTRGMSLQRKGRIGRKHPEETANSLIADDSPKIESEDFTSHLLALIVSTNVSSLDRLPIWEMPTPPPDDSVRYSLERLFILGAIDERGQATELGKMMNKFHKLSIESVKMILSGLVFGAPVKELVCLACLLSVKKTDIIRPYKTTGFAPYDTSRLMRELESDNADEQNRQRYAKCDMGAFNRLKAQLLIGCEMLELLLVYECFSEQATRLTTKSLLEWCETKGLDYWALCRVTEFVDEVYWQMLEQLQINPVSKTSAYEDLYQTMKRSTLDTDRTELVEAAIRLKRCIYEGYKCNTLVWNETTNTFNSLDGLAISRIVDDEIAHTMDLSRCRVVLLCVWIDPFTHRAIIQVGHDNLANTLDSVHRFVTDVHAAGADIHAIQLIAVCDVDIACKLPIIIVSVYH
ncbi:P-loop containing nucleoside triphosphate hydrolase [Phytophthora cactorum]|nr:P-loop containing nucleoside triphosphate hydrolase [Phytophthora cactorum]